MAKFNQTKFAILNAIDALKAMKVELKNDEDNYYAFKSAAKTLMVCLGDLFGYLPDEIGSEDEIKAILACGVVDSEEYLSHRNRILAAVEASEMLKDKHISDVIEHAEKIYAKLEEERNG